MGKTVSHKREALKQQHMHVTEEVRIDSKHYKLSDTEYDMVFDECILCHEMWRR